MIALRVPLLALAAAVCADLALAQADRVIVGAPRSTQAARPAKPASAPPAAPPPASTPEVDRKAIESVFLERSAVAAADQRCDLFTDGERIALASGLAQARGVLLRSGVSAGRIEAAGAEAAGHVGALPCDHPSVVTTAARIREAYRAFAAAIHMDYPGRHGGWSASRSRHDLWAVFTSDPASGARLGLVRNTAMDRLDFAAALPASGGPAPASARLLLRDPALHPEPWLGPIFARSDALAPPPLGAVREEWAAGLRIEPGVAGASWLVITFSDRARQRLAALDPREAVVLETTPPPRAAGSGPVRAMFEVGDFAAAAGFIAIPPVRSATAPDAD